MTRVLILANDNSTIYNFRRELLRRLIHDEYEVIISVPADDRNEVLESMGCLIEEIKLNRAGINPLQEVIVLGDYIRSIRKWQPDVVLTYTAKPNIYGSLACQFCGVPYINNVTGLGSTFQRDGFLKKVLLLLQKTAYRKSQRVFFQNASNKSYFERLGIVGDNGVLLPGSGVNLSLHKCEPYPEDCGTVRFITVSRVRKDKGFDELFDAITEVAVQRPNVEFHVVGWFEDDEYREKLDEMQRDYPVTYHGSKSQEEVHGLMARSHCLLHPSHHEGMSNVILEASATGRPCLASNIPGCKEAISDNETGLLFEVQNGESLKEAILHFLALPYERQARMGRLAREKMEKEYDRQMVVRAYLDEIKRISGIPRSSK